MLQDIVRGCSNDRGTRSRLAQAPEPILTNFAICAEEFGRAHTGIKRGRERMGEDEEMMEAGERGWGEDRQRMERMESG